MAGQTHEDRDHLTGTATTGHEWDGIKELNTPLPKWWLNMFYITMVWGIGYLIAYPGLGTFKGMLGWTEQGQYEAEMAKAEATYGPIFDKYKSTDIAKLADDAEALGVGKRLFATYCTQCHGSDAGGARGFPNLTDADWERFARRIFRQTEAGKWDDVIERVEQELLAIVS